MRIFLLWSRKNRPQDGIFVFLSRWLYFICNSIMHKNSCSRPRQWHLFHARVSYQRHIPAHFIALKYRCTVVSMHSDQTQWLRDLLLFTCSVHVTGRVKGLITGGQTILNKYVWGRPLYSYMLLYVNEILCVLYQCILPVLRCLYRTYIAL